MTDPLADPVSETARWTAASRAQESARPDALFVDPLADALATSAGHRMAARSDARTGGDNPFLPIRTRWLDDRIADVVAAGVRQVVLVAAGLDTRAFRLTWPDGTRVFEVDRPDLLAAKQAILDDQGAAARCDRRPVGADLAGSWLDALAGAGHDAGKATAWVVEGLLVYLAPAAARGVLTALTARSGAGSVLLCDLVGAGFLRSEYTREYLRDLEEQGTPWRFFVDDPEAELAAAGWRAALVDQPGSPTADFGRWPYPRPPAEGVYVVGGAEVPRTYLVRSVLAVGS